VLERHPARRDPAHRLHAARSRGAGRDAHGDGCSYRRGKVHAALL